MRTAMLHKISISGRKQSLSSELVGLRNKIANCMLPQATISRSEIPGDLTCDPRGSQGISRGLIGDLPGDRQGISSLSPLDLGTTKKCSNASVNTATRKT